MDYPIAGAPSGMSLLAGGPTSAPALLVRLLTSVSSSVTQVGSGVVRGQQSTHYRIAIDAAKMRKLEASMGDCDDDATASDAPTPIDVWLDGQGRLTRMQITDTAPSDMQISSPSTITMTLELYDYGVPVTVEPPPADQIQDLPSYSPDTSTPTPCPTS
jgi:hypothetical protein